MQLQSRSDAKKKKNNNFHLQSFLKNALVDVGGPDSGDAQRQQKNSPESRSVRLHHPTSTAADYSSGDNQKMFAFRKDGFFIICLLQKARK